jgi:type IV fimbrial biogenesis protein FimT
MKNHGFTLLELMIVIAIITIILTLTAINWQPILGRNQLANQLDRLQSYLRYARSTALWRDEIIKVCPYSKTMGCGQNWSQGLLIRHQKQIYKILPWPKNIRLNWNGPHNLILFGSKGRLASQPGHFTLKKPHTKLYYHLIISRTGKIHVGRKHSGARDDLGSAE